MQLWQGGGHAGAAHQIIQVHEFLQRQELFAYALRFLH